MKRSLLAIALLAGASSSALATLTITTGDVFTGDHGTNLIKNGSFEIGHPGGNVGWTPGSHLGGYPGTEVSSIPDWNTSWPDGAYGWWGPLGWAGDPMPDGANGLYFGNSFNTVGVPVSNIGANGVVTFSGTPTFAGRPGPVSISQTVTGLSTSLSHRLEFWVSGESNTGGFVGTGIFGLEITGEGTTYLLLPTSNNSFGGSERYYVDFTPSSSTIDIKFHNWGHITDIDGFSTELVLDDVVLNVPAPASMALVGMGALVAGRRRR